MRITEAEYNSLIARRAPAVAPAPALPAPKKIIRQSSKKMNNLERRFELECLEPWKFERRIAAYDFEVITLRIGNGVTFRPDFWTVDSEGRTVFYECKGKRVWDDAKVKIKVAAAQYQAYEFYLCRRETCGWVIDRVLP